MKYVILTKQLPLILWLLLYFVHGKNVFKNYVQVGWLLCEWRVKMSHVGGVNLPKRINTKSRKKHNTVSKKKHVTQERNITHQGP